MGTRVTKESLSPGMQVRNRKLKVVGTVRGQAHNPTELATAPDGYVSVLIPQDRPDFPFRIGRWEIKHLEYV